MSNPVEMLKDAVAAGAAKTKAKKSPAKTKGGAKAVSQVQTITMLATMVENYTEETVLAAATECYEAGGMNLFIMGGILNTINIHSWFSVDETFAGYIQKHFDLKLRKAQYMIKIYCDLVTAHLDWEQAKLIGWSKLRLISGILSQDNLAEWVERSSTMTYSELKAYMLNLDAGDGTDAIVGEDKTGTTVKMTFLLHEDQLEIVQTAIAGAKVVTETDFDSVAMEHICLEYLGTGESTSATSPSPTPAKDGGMLAVLQSLGLAEALELVEKAFPDAEISAVVK